MDLFLALSRDPKARKGKSSERGEIVSLKTERRGTGVLGAKLPDAGRPFPNDGRNWVKPLKVKSLANYRRRV